MLGHRPLKPSDYFSILRRRLWVIVLPTVFFTITLVAASYLVSPKYVSQTLVLIEQQKVPDEYVKPVISSDLDDRLASMKEQILSRSRIQPIVERFNLYPNQKMDERLDTVRKNIDIKPIRSEITRSTGLPGFYISFTAGDPRTAQQVCGEIVSLFVGENLRAREQSAQGTTDFLQSQLAEAKNNLDTQDQKLAEFQRKYVGRLPGEQSPNVNMLTSLDTQLQTVTQQLSRMEQDKSYQESLLSQQTHDDDAAAPKVAPDDRVTQLNTLQAQADDLSARYTPDYPDVVSVKRQIADLKKQIKDYPARASTAKAQESASTQQLRAQIRASEQGITGKRAEQAQIQSAIRTYQDRIQSSPMVEEEFKQITRDYQTAQKFYDDLLGKMNQSKMATSLERRQQGEQFRVMDEPNLPDTPSFPKRPLFAVGGLFLGLMVGLGITGLVEYQDTAIRSDKDVMAFLKLDTIGAVELVGEKQKAFTAPTFAEKLHGIFNRTHLRTTVERRQ